MNWSQKTRRVIRQNLAWALLYNLTILPLAGMGWVAPYAAAIGTGYGRRPVPRLHKRGALPVEGVALRLNIA